MLFTENLLNNFRSPAEILPIKFNTSVHSVQPVTLKEKISALIPWISSSQYLINSLKPETVAEQRGQLNFTLSYDKTLETLYIHIIEAIGLPIRDFTGSSDPYVQAFLLPDMNKCLRTKIHRRNLHPKFKETLSFRDIPLHELNKKTLVMQVMDYDRFTRDDPIGEVLLPLNHVKPNHGLIYWKTLQRPTASKDCAGEIRISLRYTPEKNVVLVHISEARYLPIKDKCVLPDRYVKLWLIQNGNKVAKQKTNIQKGTVAPVFNEVFEFTVPHREELQTDVNLVITVMNFEMITSNAEVGHVVIGNLGLGNGSEHWQEMLNHENTSVSRWHKLYTRL